MTLGIDTDVLVSWLVEVAPRHGAARRWIEIEVQEHGRKIAIAPQVIHEFLHIVTDSRRFSHPLSMLDAIQRMWGIWDSEEVLQILPTPAVVPRTLELLATFHLGRKRILDTALAATLELAGIRRLATFNSSDFKIFDFLDLVDPPLPEPGPRRI